MGQECIFLGCRVFALWCDFGIGADIGGVPSYGEKKEKHQSEKNPMCSDTISKHQPSGAKPTPVHIDYCCYRHEVHLEQPPP